MLPDQTNEPELLALRALGSVMEEKRLAERFLSLSGMTAPELRQCAGEPRLLAALLGFLEAHEPDLIAISNRLGVAPADLVAARQAIES